MATGPVTRWGGAEEIQRLRFTLDHVGAYVFTKDTDGRYTYANEMVCALFGLPLKDVIGCTDDQFFDLSVSDELRQNDLRVLQSGDRVESEERNVIAETGEERIYWSVKVPLRDAQGRIAGLCGISTDITERRRLEQELAEQKDVLSQVLENMDAFVYMKDRERRYIYANSNLARLYGLTVDAIVGRLEEELLPPATAEKFAALDEAVFSGGQKVTGEEIVHGLDGEDMHCWSIKIPLFKDGEADRLLGISTDITEIIKLKNEFHDLARSDSLTGFLTRRFLFEHAEMELKRAQRRNTHLALLMVDIDHFKGINDTYGHAFGDAYIIAIADALRKTLRESDLIGRLGGDEFVIVMDETDDAGMRTAAERFVTTVKGTIVQAPDGVRIPLSISVGAALSGPAGSIDDVMALADAALYRAKEAGRGCWRAASAEA